MGVVTVPKVEFELSAGVWTDVTADVLQSGGIRFGYGSRGNGPTNRTADSGPASMVLKNGVDSSGGVDGYYTLLGPNCRAGFKLNMRMRISVLCTAVHPDPVYKYIGKLANSVPHEGLAEPIAEVFFVDWMDDAARFFLTGRVTPLLNTRMNNVVAAVLAAAPSQPNASDLHTGSDLLPFAPSVPATERVSAMAELNRLQMTELGRTFLVPGGSTAAAAASLTARLAAHSAAAVGTLTVLSRTDFVDHGVFTGYNATIGPNLTGGTVLTADVDREKCINVFKMTAHPREVGADFVELFRLAPPISIGPMQTETFEARYSDPDQPGQFISAHSVIVSVLFNDNADASGDDLTGTTSTFTRIGPDKVRIAITNNHATRGGFAFCAVVGIPLFNRDPVDAVAEDAASITANGEKEASIDMFYQPNLLFARIAGTHLLRFWKDPALDVQAFAFHANNGTAEAGHALGTEPGQRVMLPGSRTNANARPYQIQAVDYEIRQGGMMDCVWTVTREVDTGLYMAVGVAGRCELGGANTKLSL